jgi:uncharacterized membrane protein (DUF4010 family)
VGDVATPRRSTSIRSPFSLKQAVTFAAIYTLVLVAMPASRAYVGKSGVYLTTALSSLLDVDAVTIALARRIDRSVSVREASTSILLAVIVNTLFKLGVAAFMGEDRFRRWVGLSLGAMALVGALAATITHFAIG